ncbi:MAG TPA: PIN domain-containing protein [Verrucomicrobiales bacterium]|jgi:predicted nucleic acid-binding protein|nr:PIN domain-containing protein [Verrucomicrobiales bacterium]
MIFADASFLVALFVAHDDHWRTAWKWWQHRKGPVLTVTRLCLFEVENTIRGLTVSKLLRTVELRTALEGIKRGVLEGFISRRTAPEHQLPPLADRLSQHHTMRTTFGAMDILHVAAALHLRAKAFLSFDQRQRELAAAEGLEVLPV